MANYSETSDKIYQTTGRNNQEGSHLHIRRHENLNFRDCAYLNKNTDRF